MRNHPTVKIVTELDIVAARQLCRNVAKEVGFGVVDQARIATATSELAKNIFLYATTGEILVEKIENEDKKGIAIIAIDYGPGIENPHKLLEEGYPNKCGESEGLLGVKRLMDSIQIHSELGKGTVIRIEKWVK
ncbi:MAG: anti-sigma regulatory factor [Lysinibacillus sp.]|nr:anti-sigma regulatory factor [Lysinibacillus sp.]